MTLTDSEMEYIEGILGRKMNELEEGMLDVMFSEHCSYKSSRPILGTFPTEGENIILGPFLLAILDLLFLIWVVHIIVL